MSSELIGYLTSGGIDLSNVFMNINGASGRRSGSGTSPSNISVSPNVPVLIGACINDDTSSRSGMGYATALYNSTTNILYLDTATFVPTIQGWSPFNSIARSSSGNLITVTAFRSGQTFNWFEMKLNMSDTGLVTNDLDLVKLFKNINGYSTHSSGSYVNSTTTRTIPIPSANTPYQLIAYSLGPNVTGMINAYVYHTTTSSGGGVSLTSNIGTTTLLFSTPAYNISGTITLNTSQTNTNIIYYNFNTLY